MKPCVYILQLANGEYYIGSSNNIEGRIVEHNTGQTPSLKYKLPATLIFQKEFDNIVEARQIELRLKKKKSRKIIEKILESGVISIK